MANRRASYYDCQRLDRRPGKRLVPAHIFPRLYQPDIRGDFFVPIAEPRSGVVLDGDLLAAMRNEDSILEQNDLAELLENFPMRKYAWQPLHASKVLLSKQKNDMSCLDRVIFWFITEWCVLEPFCRGDLIACRNGSFYRVSAADMQFFHGR